MKLRRRAKPFFLVFNMEKARIHIFISGLVQGVFFRDSARKEAKKLGLLGWVRNLSDGRVEIMAEGDKEKLEDLLEWSKRGPLIAEVEKVDFEWEEYSGEFNSFEISY